MQAFIGFGVRHALIGASLLLAGSAARAQAPDPYDNQHPPYTTTWFQHFTDPVEQRIEALMTMMAGEYRGRWPGAFAKRPDLDEVPAWAVLKRVPLPAFGTRVFFMEVREGGPTGRVLRQRIVQLADDPERSHNYLRNYFLLDFDRYARADLDPAKLAALTPRNLPLLTRGCQSNIIGDGDGFLIESARASCVLTYPDGKARYNDFRFRFAPDGFTFFEAAYDIDGKMMAGARQPVRFTRIAPPS